MWPSSGVSFIEVNGTIRAPVSDSLTGTLAGSPWKVAPGAGDEIKTDLADVKEKLNALRAQSHGELQAQTNALKTALLKLQGAASTLSSNPSASAVSDVVAALREVTSSGSTLLAALSKKCPSASALSGM